MIVLLHNYPLTSAYGSHLWGQAYVWVYCVGPCSLYVKCSIETSNILNRKGLLLALNSRSRAKVVVGHRH